MNYISPHQRHSFHPQPHYQNKTYKKYTLHPINQKLHFSSGYPDPSRVSCRILNTVGLYYIEWSKMLVQVNISLFTRVNH